MGDTVGRKQKPGSQNKVGFRGPNWCCSSSSLPNSPDNQHRYTTTSSLRYSSPSLKTLKPRSGATKRHLPSESPASSASSTKLGGIGGFIDRRRILSPGRVSPIESIPSDPDPVTAAPSPPPPRAPPAMPPDVSPAEGRQAFPESYEDLQRHSTAKEEEEENDGFFASGAGAGGRCDVRVCLIGKSGDRVLMDLHSEVLCAKSSVFRAKILDSRRTELSSGGGGGGGIRKCWMEISDVADIGVYKETIELMYERNVGTKLMKAGVARAIAILEVSFSIMFEIGVRSCLQYVEAVPWCEEEEESLRIVFTNCKFDRTVAKEVLARLYPEEQISCQNLTTQLLQSVIEGSDDKARKELKSLVHGLLSKSSVYQKDPTDISKDRIYAMCHSCIRRLNTLLSEPTTLVGGDRTIKDSMPLIGRISLQVDNLIWLLDILIGKEMADDFLAIWTDQTGLLQLYNEASPMVRYEISRISAAFFLVLGKGRLQCSSCLRCRFVETWLSPMLNDFGWLQRRSKGLDMKVLEEAIGQTILTLPLKNQQSLLMSWFECFTKNGNDCPNLSKAFQVWWRRSFTKAPDRCSDLISQA